MRFPLIAFLFIFLALPFAANAASTATAPQPAWNVQPIFDPTGGFAFCLMDRTEADGRKMTIALNPRNEINLGFAIPNAGLKPGALYDIVLAFGSGWTRTIRAEALNPQTLLFQLGTSSDAPRALMTSDNVSLQAANGKGSKVAFALPLMKDSLNSLHECLEKNKGKVNKSAAMPLMPPGLQKLLDLAGLSQAQPLSLEDIPPADRPADFMWKLGSIVGGARQRDVPAGKSLDEFVQLHLAALKNKCGPAFTTQIGKDQPLPNITLTTVDANCARAEHPVFLAILYYLTSEHQLSIITHEGPPAEKAGAVAARDALVKAIAAIANLPPPPAGGPQTGASKK